VFLTIISAILLLASAATGAVALRGSDPWARLLGYTLVSSKVTILIIVLALATEHTFYLDIALVYTVLGYIGVLVLADYMAGQSTAYAPEVEQ